MKEDEIGKDRAGDVKRMRQLMASPLVDMHDIAPAVLADHERCLSEHGCCWIGQGLFEKLTTACKNVLEWRWC